MASAPTFQLKSNWRADAIHPHGTNIFLLVSSLLWFYSTSVPLLKPPLTGYATDVSYEENQRE